MNGNLHHGQGCSPLQGRYTLPKQHGCSACVTSSLLLVYHGSSLGLFVFGPLDLASLVMALPAKSL